MKTAKLWVYWNDTWTKLIIRPGETRTLHVGGPTDEGYFSCTETYSYNTDNETLELEIDSHSSDCDGPMSSNRVVFCPVNELMSIEPYDNQPQDIRLPNWQKLSYSQRDVYAEMAGY